MTQTGRKFSVSDRTLNLLLRAGIIILVVGIPLFGVLYFLDQRSPAGPSLVDRQIQGAEGAVKTSPNNLSVRLALAKSYRDAKRYDDALNQYDTILKVDATNRAALLGRGGTLMDKGDLDAAIDCYKKITNNKTDETAEFAKMDPQLQEAHFFLGSIYAKQNKNADALKELEAALRIDRADADSWYVLGTVQAKNGENDKAIASFRRALAFVPTGWCEPYQGLVDAYKKANQPPQAEYATAMLAFCNKDTTEAVRRLKTLTDGPEALDAALGLGTISETSHQRDEAIEWYRKVLALDPKNNTALAALDRLGVPATPAPAPSASSSTKTS